MFDKLLIGDKVQLGDPQANTAPPNIPFLALSATSSRFGLSMGSILDSTSTNLGVSLYRVDDDPTMTLLPATTMFLSVSEGIVGQKERQDTADTWSNTPSVAVSILVIFTASKVLQNKNEQRQIVVVFIWSLARPLAVYAQMSACDWQPGPKFLEWEVSNITTGP